MNMKSQNAPDSAPPGQAGNHEVEMMGNRPSGKFRPNRYEDDEYALQHHDMGIA